MLRAHVIGTSIMKKFRNKNTSKYVTVIRYIPSYLQSRYQHPKWWKQRKVWYSVGWTEDPSQSTTNLWDIVRFGIHCALGIHSMRISPRGLTGTRLRMSHTHNIISAFSSQLNCRSKLSTDAPLLRMHISWLYLAIKLQTQKEKQYGVCFLWSTVL
jgi:hypothetical protein